VSRSGDPVLAAKLLALVPPSSFATEEQVTELARDVGACRRAYDVAEAERHLTEQRIPLPEADLQRLARGDFERTPAMRAVAEWLLTDRHRFLLLAGRFGVGKTFASGRALVRVGGDYVRAGRLAVMATAFAGDGAREWVRLCRSRDLVVVDELGAEPRTCAAALTEFADERLTGVYRRTVFVTNLTRDELRDTYGERFYDRLRGHGRAVWLGGESMRRQR
jgi:DNA replication protein DnaC